MDYAQPADPPTGRPGAVARQSQHGGSRPGAGAKPGNINAIKHGKRSTQLRRAVDKLMSDSDTRALLYTITTLTPDQLPLLQQALATHARRHRAAARRATQRPATSHKRTSLLHRLPFLRESPIALRNRDC
jgi:hypothetical protein